MKTFFRHFTLIEFFIHCTEQEISSALISRSVSRNIVNLCFVLDRIRDYINAPVRINSAYRSLTRNSSVGGVSTSQHLLGSAADVRKSKELCNFFNRRRGVRYDFPEFLHRLGIYQLIEYDTFYHIGIYDEKHDPEHYPSVYIDKTTSVLI